MNYALVEAAFAAARNQLETARIAQKNALIWSFDVYRAGARGERARFLLREWDKRRRLALDEALRTRRKIHELRAALRRLELDDTIPPRSAA